MNKRGRSSKFSLLPLQVRYHAYNLLVDGATSKTVAEDPVIRAAMEKTGVSLSPKNIAMIRKCQEFADFSAMRRKHLEAKRKDMMLAAISQGTGTLESMTEQARCRLMEILSELSDLSDLSDEDRIKALRSLAQSMAAISNPAKDSRIADLQRKLREKEARLHAAEADWKAREAELLAKLAEARKNTPAGMSKETLEEVEDKIKLL